MPHLLSHPSHVYNQDSYLDGDAESIGLLVDVDQQRQEKEEADRTRNIAAFILAFVWLVLVGFVVWLVLDK